MLWKPVRQVVIQGCPGVENQAFAGCFFNLDEQPIVFKFFDGQRQLPLGVFVAFSFHLVCSIIICRHKAVTNPYCKRKRNS